MLRTDALAVFVQSFDQAEKSALGRIRNIGKHRIFDVVINTFQNLRHKLPSELLALAVNILVAAPREIDPLERTGPDRPRRGKRIDRYLSVASHDQSVARRQLPDIFVPEVECRLDHRALRSGDDDLVVAIVERRTDSGRVPHDKRVAMADHPRHRISPVPTAGRQRQYFLEVDVLGQHFGDVVLRIAFIFKIAVLIVVFTIEEMTDALENRHRIGFCGRILPQLDQPVEQFVDIGQVKIPGQHQAPRHPVVLARDRVHVLDVVFAESPVTQVSQKNLAGKLHLFFQQQRILQHLRVLRDRFVDPDVDLLKNILDRSGSVRTHPVDINASGFRVQLDVGHSRAVLSPVVLLLHQDMHFVKSVERGAVLFQVVIGRLEQADKGNAALVFDRIAHNVV